MRFETPYGRGGRSITWGMVQGAAELRPDAGLGPDVQALVILFFILFVISLTIFF
jgi:hypothetical protein